MEYISRFGENDAGLKLPGFFKIHGGVRYDDYGIAYSSLPGSRSVQAAHPGSPFAFDQIGFNA